MKALVGLWLRWISGLVPADERRRWREEWRADLWELGRRGAGPWEMLSWTAGVTRAAFEFRMEDVTMGGWGREIRHAARGLLRRPGFAVVTVLTLALGIGANTAIFSVLNGVLLQPLSYEEPGELVYITSAFPGMGFDEFWISEPEYLGLRERVGSLASVGAWRTTRVSLGGVDRPVRVTGAVASWQLFETLGVLPFLGRWYTAEEDAGDAPVLVLSHELWVRDFGADPGILEQTVRVNGRTRDVIGVMPPGFDVDDAGIEAWIPLGLNPAEPGPPASHYLNVVGRLQPGATPATSGEELTQVVARWNEDSPGGHTPHPESHPMAMKPLQDQVVGDIRQPLALLMGAVGLVLLIACANVANLLLARAETRQKEISVRVALGAGRARLLQQFLVEGLLLAGAGAVVGTLAAWGFLEGLRAAAPPDIPRIGEVGLDPTVLAFTAVVTVLVGILFGFAPARHVREGIGSAMRENSGRSTGGAGRHRLRSLLVVGEMALAVILVVGSGLLIRSFQALTRVDPGFEVENRLTFELYLSEEDYPEMQDPLRFMDRLQAEIGALPGVASVAVMDGLPPLMTLSASDVEFDGVEARDDGPAHNVDYFDFVTANYLETMGTEVVRGRGFRASDDEGDVPVVLVNETLARTFYPGENPVGRRVRPCCGDGMPWMEIVGVVEDVKQEGVDRPSGTQIYYNVRQAARAGYETRGFYVLVRTDVPPGSLASRVREAVWALDPALPVADLRTLGEVMNEARARSRFLTQLLGLFGFLALALAAIGTYGVMSYSVEQRTREMGIRMALGAPSDGVRRLILRDGLAVALVGLVVGIGGALALSGVMDSLLFGVAATDPVTFVAVPLTLGLVATVACWIPAVRATRVDPVEVLKEE